MPYLRIETNASCSEESCRALLDDAGRFVSEQLGKDQQYLMGIVETDRVMTFGGTADPLASCELEALELPADLTTLLTKGLCARIEQHFGIPGDRIYVKFSNVERGLWGWNSKVF